MPLLDAFLKDLRIFGFQFIFKSNPLKHDEKCEWTGVLSSSPVFSSTPYIWLLVPVILRIPGVLLSTSPCFHWHLLCGHLFSISLFCQVSAIHLLSLLRSSKNVLSSMVLLSLLLISISLQILIVLSPLM